MINTRIEWLPEIKDNWKITRVKKVFNISKEKAKQKDPTILSLARSKIKVRDISNNEGQLAANYEDYNPVIVGDLLLNPMDLYSGANCNVSEVDGVISPAYSNLRKKVDLNPYYFDYYFKVQYWTMAMFAHGKGVSFDNRWTLNSEGLLNYELPFPSYDEQNKIVAAIKAKEEKINQLIANQEKQIEKLKEYKQSLITEIVTKGLEQNVSMKDSGLDWISYIPKNWSTFFLKRIFLFKKGLPITKENLKETGIKVISYGQIHAKYNKTIIADNALYRYVDSDYINTNKSSLVDLNDFIFADTSEDLNGVGDCVRINIQDLIFAGYHSIILKAKEPKHSHYLSYLFLTDNWRSQFRKKVNGVKLFSVTQRILASGNIILPPLNEQNKICDYLDKKCTEIDRLINIKLSKIEKLNDYKKSLIYEYVTGKKEVE